MTTFADVESLEAGLPHILDSPPDLGTVELVARRPSQGEREVLDEGVLDLEDGLVGDRWQRLPAQDADDDGKKAQITLMNARVIEILAGERARWALAGDQLYVDLDLGPENLPAGTRLQVGTATLEVTDLPHTGCAKFTSRFGSEATRFVNSKAGRAHRMRGMNARVVEPGIVRPGDTITKL